MATANVEPTLRKLPVQYEQAALQPIEDQSGVGIHVMTEAALVDAIYAHPPCALFAVPTNKRVK